MSDRGIKEIFSKLEGDKKELNPPGFKIQLATAKAHLERKDYHLARRALENALNLAPNNAEGHYQYGVFFQTRESHHKAVESLRRAVKLAPDSDLYRTKLSKSLRRIAHGFYNNEKFAQAAGYYARAMRVSTKDHASDHFQLAKCINEQEDHPDKAEQLDLAEYRFKKAVELSEATDLTEAEENNIKYRIALADFYYDQERWFDATEQYSAAIKAGPTDKLAYLHYARGCARQKIWQFTEADEDFQIAIQKEPNNPEYYLALAELHQEWGLVNLALEYAERALELAERRDNNDEMTATIGEIRQDLIIAQSSMDDENPEGPTFML